MARFDLIELKPCGECGMPCKPNEYHPYAACLMFKGCHNSTTVRANLSTLSARASAGEGVTQRIPAFVGEWHARAVALGYDGVADMLHSVERGEPPLHGNKPGIAVLIAEVDVDNAARAGDFVAVHREVWRVVKRAALLTAAPQPAQAGASGGGEDLAMMVRRLVRAIRRGVAGPVLCDAAMALVERAGHASQPLRDTPASPATGDELSGSSPMFDITPQPAAAQGGEWEVEAAGTDAHPQWWLHRNGRAFFNFGYGENAELLAKSMARALTRLDAAPHPQESAK